MKKMGNLPVLFCVAPALPLSAAADRAGPCGQGRILIFQPEG